MACDIKITGVFGIGSPMDAIRVAGTVSECAAPLEGDPIAVRLSCRSAVDGFVEVGAKVVGENWQAIFPAPPNDCSCGGPVFVQANCVSEPNCGDDFAGEVTCVDCPSLHWSDEDDVGLPNAVQICEPDGHFLLDISFSFFNDSAPFTQALINPGPGGIVVSIDAPIVGPGGTATCRALLRYGPAITPTPQPFVEFRNLDGSLRGCPIQFIPLPIIKACPPACPQQVILQVTGPGNATIDLGDGGPACLPQGGYEVCVLSPLVGLNGAPIAKFNWTLNSQLQSEDGPCLEVFVVDGTTQEVIVHPSLEDCPEPAATVELVGCEANCDIELELEVRNSAGLLMPPGDCLPKGSYNLIAKGGAVPPWAITWVIDGQADTSTTGTELSIDIGFEQVRFVEITATVAGCPPVQATRQLSGCSDSTGGFWGCMVHLLVALAMMIGGSITVIVGFCVGNPPAIVIGLVALALSWIIFGLWVWLCAKNTACNVLIHVNCALSWLILANTILAGILGLSAFWCGIVALTMIANWALAKVAISDAIAEKGCPNEPCISKTVKDIINLIAP